MSEIDMVYRKYGDMINMSRPISKTHPKMPMEKRAAQFAPFAALTGYEGAIEETAKKAFEEVERNYGRDMV